MQQGKLIDFQKHFTKSYVGQIQKCTNFYIFFLNNVLLNVVDVMHLIKVKLQYFFFIKVMEMGFTQQEARLGLRMTEGNTQMAVAHIMRRREVLWFIR